MAKSGRGPDLLFPVTDSDDNSPHWIRIKIQIFQLQVRYEFNPEKSKNPDCGFKTRIVGWNSERWSLCARLFWFFGICRNSKKEEQIHGIWTPTSIIKFTIISILCVKILQLAIHNNNNKIKQLQKSDIY